MEGSPGTRSFMGLRGWAFKEVGGKLPKASILPLMGIWIREGWVGDRRKKGSERENYVVVTKAANDEAVPVQRWGWSWLTQKQEWEWCHRRPTTASPAASSCPRFICNHKMFPIWILSTITLHHQQSPETQFMTEKCLLTDKPLKRIMYKTACDGQRKPIKWTKRCEILEKTFQSFRMQFRSNMPPLCESVLILIKVQQSILHFSLIYVFPFPPGPLGVRLTTDSLSTCRVSGLKINI